MKKKKKQNSDNPTFASKFERLLNDLNVKGLGTMTCFGQSMMPIIKSGSTLTFEKRDSYEVDDIVFCRVNGRYIDAHKIVAVDSLGRFLIANNHGHNNGWTNKIFGKAVNATFNGVEKNL